ncbi:hypothetical protein TNCV_4391621 [Trichonephila clavipes]|nr:hypothetical protein TNCV_4391621 [Trichonephila clavipes]
MGRYWISLSHSSSTHYRCFKQPVLHLRDVGASYPSFPSGLGHSHILTGRTPWWWSEASHLSSSSTNLTRVLADRRLFRVPPCRKGTIHLQTSVPSPVFEHGTAVSVINHCTESTATPMSNTTHHYY